MSMKIQTWPIIKLKEYAKNPRKNDHAVDAVAKAISEFGFRVPIIAKSDGTVVDGHLRLKAARQIGLTKIPVVLADDMTDAQIKAFRLSVNQMATLADWDYDLLKFELEELQGMNFDMDVIGFDDLELQDIFAGDAPENYSRKIETPIYEVRGEKPHVTQLCDTTKTKELKREIEKAEIPDEIAQFLILAADRHTVFNYSEIAEFYAHSSNDVQELMERSALLIIDFDQAIEYGFVNLAEGMMDQVANIKAGGQNEK